MTEIKNPGMVYKSYCTYQYTNLLLVMRELIQKRISIKSIHILQLYFVHSCSVSCKINTITLTLSLNTKKYHLYDNKIIIKYNKNI